MSQSSSASTAPAHPSVDELRRLFEASTADALYRVRAFAVDDPLGCALVVRRLEPTFGRRGGLDLAASALATLLEVDGSVEASAAAWTVAVSEAIDHGDGTLLEVAQREKERLAGELAPSWSRPPAKWARVSRSIRAMVSRVLASPALPTAADIATLLQREHPELGDGLLGSSPPPGPGARRMPVMSWLVPTLQLYLDVTVVNTAMLLLALSDRDAAVRTALQANGAEYALERELAVRSTPRRRWTPHHEGRRLVTTATTMARLEDVTVAIPGGEAVLLITAAGDVQVWSPQNTSQTSHERLPLSSRLGDERILSGLMADRRRINGSSPSVMDQWAPLVWPVAVMTTSGLTTMQADGLRRLPVSPGLATAVVAGWLGSGRAVAVLRTDGVAEIRTPFFPAAETMYSVESRPTSPQLVPSGVAPVAMVAAADNRTSVIVVAHEEGVTGWWPDTGAVRTIAPDRSAGLTRCLAAGKLGRQDVVLAGTTYGADLWSVRTGLRVAAIDHPRPIVDCDWAELDGRAVIALTDEDGLVQVWDVADLSPLTAVSRSIDGVATARFATFDGAPSLVTRTTEGRAELRHLALATVVDEVPQYRSDDIAPAREHAIGTRDALGRETEADAIAEIVTSRGVRPPLAIGLFGEWGEGKSYFMERIWKHVGDRADRARNDPEGPTSTSVRQIRFNAWHYAEADLWASLVAELFEQLARCEAAEDGSGSISVLRAELVRQSQLRRRLDDAQRLRGQLDAEVASRTPTRPAFEALEDTDRQALVAILGVDAAKPAYEAFRAGTTIRARSKGRAATVRRALRDRPGVLVGLSVLALATIGFLVLASATGVGWLVGAGVALVPTLAVVGSVLDTARAARRHFDAGVDKVKTIVAQQSAELDALVVRRDVVAAEVDQLQAEYDRVVAAGQLAGILEERLRDGSYRSRLGLMSQIHHDFVEMARLLPPARKGDRPANLPSIERIVVYIDDLDRCPPARVVEVLEAIHLLLAVPLFVVIVSVDPRWLLRALNAHYRQLLSDPDPVTGDGDGAELWRTTPLHYLEKIFQVPFTLSPLDRDRYEAFVDDLVKMPGPTASPSPPPTTPPEAKITEMGEDLPPPATDGKPAPETESVTPTVTPATSVHLPAPPSAEELDALLLHDDEGAFLKLLGPPLVTTPRAVKRLVNSYGLLLALAGRDDRARIIGPDEQLGVTIRPHRASLTLLAAVVGAPDSAPVFFTNLHEAPPDLTWDDYLARQLQYGGDMGRLARMLMDVTAEAAARATPVPPLVGHWREWVVPCGRLSFQTGRVVVRLRADAGEKSVLSV